MITMLLAGLLLIATERYHHMNKAAVAMFVGVVCWLLYLGSGTRFVVSEHPIDFLSFLSQTSIKGDAVKEFVASFVFVKYAMGAAEVILFLIATMSIVDVLNNNGCFDFLSEWLRTHSSVRFLWMVAGVTFLLSANLDNLMTVGMMLAVLHTLVAASKMRMLYGAVIVFSAACGGAFTVIGDVTSLMLWTKGLITPTNYSAVMFVPCLVALVVTLALVARELPARMELSRPMPLYRGDDTLLTRPQRLLMLLVGIGGLWFIPTFHRITHFSPFVGALCVLALLWIVDELCNRKRMESDQTVSSRSHLALQYANIQSMLFFAGIVLAAGAVKETGVCDDVCGFLMKHVGNIYIIGVLSGLLSGFFSNIAVLTGCISVFAPDGAWGALEPLRIFGTDGAFWPLISFSTAMGSSLFLTGTLAGFSLMKMETLSYVWYLRKFTPKVLAGWAAGLACFYFIVEFL